MSSYNFDHVLPSQGDTYDIQMDTTAGYGYFEHKKLGEDRAGGLWFTKDDSGKWALSDYDGVACLPALVIFALRANGYVVEEHFE